MHLTPGAQDPCWGKQSRFSRLGDLCGLFCKNTPCPPRKHLRCYRANVSSKSRISLPVSVKPRGLRMMANAECGCSLKGQGLFCICHVSPKSSHTLSPRGNPTLRRCQWEWWHLTPISSPFNLMVYDPQHIGEEIGVQVSEVQRQSWVQIQVWLSPELVSFLPQLLPYR